MTSQLTGAESIRWDLSDLFSGLDDPSIESTLTTAKHAAESFSSTYKGRVASLHSADLRQAYDDLQSLMAPMYKLSQYSHLVYSVDTSNEAAQKLVARVEEASSHLSNEILFFKLEVAKLPVETLQQHLASEELIAYRYNLARAKDLERYQLTEKEEQLSNLKDLVGANAFQQLYSELTASFEFEFTYDGKTETLNGSQLRALRQHENPTVRREAMKLFFDRYKDNKIVISKVFNTVLKDHTLEKNLRGYTSDIGVMNIHNDLSDETIAILHDVTTESNTLVQRYYRLKKKLLKLDEMTLVDIYAPMPETSQKFTYDEAKTIVLDGFKSFDDEFYRLAKHMFDDNRIDAPVEPKKRGGAYCSSSTTDLDPYVFLNFLGRARDVSTMAHELGHAIHAMLCKDLPLINSHAILPLCETASVFSEMVITDKLLNELDSDAHKVALLTDKLEDMFATSHRQNMFSMFEMAAHAAIDKATQSPEELCAIYKTKLEAMFGDAVSIPEEYHWEWATIPHFIDVPFYVYAYNFGNLLVMALYQQYKSEGPSFIPKLKTMLSLGKSVSPIEICDAVGVDITNRVFWAQSVAYIESLITQLEELV